MKYVSLSKFLCLLLRHTPSLVGLNIDQQGWVDIDELVSKINSSGKARETITREIVEFIVANDNKNRLIISDDNKKVRASQGHSFNVDLGLVAKEPPMQLYHGTIDVFWDHILTEGDGLKKMKRQHVHLSPDIETAISVGKRRTGKGGAKAVVLVVQAGRMWADGVEFFLSANGVWLTDFVPLKYVSLLPKEQWPIDEKLWQEVSKRTEHLFKGYNGKPDY